MYGHAYKISQQSHKSAPTADRSNLSMCIIAHTADDDFTNQDRECVVTLSPFASLRVNSAKGLSRWAKRCFAALSMTVPTLVVKIHHCDHYIYLFGAMNCASTRLLRLLNRGAFQPAHGIRVPGRLWSLTQNIPEMESSGR